MHPPLLILLESSKLWKNHSTVCLLDKNLFAFGVIVVNILLDIQFNNACFYFI